MTAEAAECEFVCIPRPLERSPGADGGPLRYRVVHRVQMWRPGERPRLERRILEGDPGLALCNSAYQRIGTYLGGPN